MAIVNERATPARNDISVRFAAAQQRIRAASRRRQLFHLACPGVDVPNRRSPGTGKTHQRASLSHGGQIGRKGARARWQRWRKPRVAYQRP
jgi:hypothetical protein